jgi:hypothetical protein
MKFCVSSARKLAGKTASSVCKFSSLCWHQHLRCDRALGMARSPPSRNEACRSSRVSDLLKLSQLAGAAALRTGAQGPAPNIRSEMLGRIHSSPPQNARQIQAE